MKNTPNKLRLLEIKEEIKELANEAISVVAEETKGQIFARANAYWHPQILMTLDKEHDYMGGSMCTLEDTIKEINEANREVRVETHKGKFKQV